VWTAARQPAVAARAELLEKAERALYEGALAKERGSTLGELFADDAERLRQIEARGLLEQAGGANSPNMTVRLRYANVIRSMAQDQKPINAVAIESANKILRSVIANRPAPVIASVTWTEIALCHAVLGQREKEIHAYGEALALEPLGYHRAVLLANRAESYMGMGRLEEGIAGYRESIAALLPIEMHVYGVTTLWGLAVALDRQGDLEDALEKIKLAREYDPLDARLRSGSWFYSPPHDEYWYKALGAWSVARASDYGFEKDSEYARALDNWESYIGNAPANDPYVAFALARREACEKERLRTLAKARKN
jgi:tetratricopeptide (TPR) repeat protein